MAEELVANLDTYKAQLQQVEAALTTDENNDELVKLKQDLVEVIELTLDLAKVDTSVDINDELIPTSGDAQNVVLLKVGEKCSAVYTENGKVYNGEIIKINYDGTCSFKFDGYDTVQTKKLSALKKPVVRKLTKEEAIIRKAKKAQKELEIEKRKAKTERWKQRQKVVEEERELDKKKWQSFKNKAISRSKKGMIKKSIFSSSDYRKVGVSSTSVSTPKLRRK